MSTLNNFVNELIKENKVNKMKADIAEASAGGLVSADLFEKLRKNQLPLTISQLYGEAATKTIEGIPKGSYNLKSQEFANFLNIPEVQLQPSLKIYDRFSPATDLSDVDNEISKAIGEGSWNPSVQYFETLKQQGVTIDDLKALTAYQNFPANWKEGGAVEKINKLTQIAQQNPNPIYSFSTQEGPLYRGGLSKNIPEVGQEFSFEGNRFKSFSPDLITAWDFIQGRAPAWKDYKNKIPVDTKDSKAFEGRNTLFQIVQEPKDKYNYLITPGPQESEVLGRPDARYKVLDKTTFKDFESKLMAKPIDIDVIRLQQIYGIDPFSAAIEGGKNLIKQNPTGSLLGTSVSLMNPEVAKAVEQNRYGKAAGAFAKDVVTGALTETGIKSAVPIAGKFAPALIRAAAPVARLAGPVATGTALFGQGQTGSLTDVLARKAAANPVSWMPSVKANPKTDIGARAGKAIGNEARYMWQQILRGKIPYTR